MDTQNNTNIALHLTLLFAVLVAAGLFLLSFEDTNNLENSLLKIFVLFLIFLPLAAFSSILVYRDLNALATANPDSFATKIILFFHILFGLIGVVLVFIGLATIIHDISYSDFTAFFIHIIILLIGTKIIHANLYKKFIRRS